MRSLLVSLLVVGSPALAQDLRGSSFASVHAGVVTPTTAFALTEGASFLFGVSPNVMIDVGVSYYEVNQAFVLTNADIAGDGKEIDLDMNKYELSLAGTVKYFVSRLPGTGIRPFVGAGLGVHYSKSETYLDGDVNDTLKTEYNIQKTHTDVSLDPVAGIAAFWTNDLMLYAEARYMLVFGEKYNETSLTTGFAIRL